MAASRYLRVIASDTAVPALQAMLADAAVSDLALYVLQQIPGAAAGRALVQAAGTTSGATRMAVIAALGDRQETSAVPVLMPLLKQPEYREAAATALGRIGSDEAVAALEAALAGAPADFKAHVAAAILAGRGQPARGDQPEWRPSALRDARRGHDAAGPHTQGSRHREDHARGKVAGPLLLDMLGGSDPIQREAAVARIREVFEPDAIGPVCALLPRLPEASSGPGAGRARGLSRGRVLPTILQAAGSNAVDVRIAAMKALESTGGASVVPLLVDTAARTRGDEQAAARSALGMLKGRAVDEALLDMLAKNPAEAVARELLLAVADRQYFAAKPAVAAALTSPSQTIRVQALKTLRVIGTPSDIPAVLDALLKAGDEVERAEAEQTAAALAQKMSNPDGRAGEVRTRLGIETRSGSAGASDRRSAAHWRSQHAAAAAHRARERRPLVVDAAVGAITAWPTSAARDDILRLAHDLEERDASAAGDQRARARGRPRSVSRALRGGRGPEAGSRVGVAPGGKEARAGRACAVPMPGGSGPGKQVPAGASRSEAEAQATVDTIRKRMAGGRGGIPVGQGGDTGEQEHLRRV